MLIYATLDYSYDALYGIYNMYVFDLTISSSIGLTTYILSTQ